ncbi:Uncharacterized protein dnm_055780 [Desulfonema magnum]|uniref:Uncharacterized protein n=1 Tax=Desulfonema magnum TaxID=45655 RepID=A0A975BQB2_9BACT|nr:Uncharacterized protein dnm_055780 [Desulfonema magnum]
MPGKKPGFFYRKYPPFREGKTRVSPLFTRKLLPGYLCQIYT